MGRLRRLSGHLGGLAAVLALLLAVGLLPPDTSLRQVREAGLLRACVPTSYPPLVTGAPEAPGIDVELLTAVAERLDVQLGLNEIAAIGRDFNPRNWGVTRAHCQVIAGGVIASPLTRSFLETGPAYARTGWAAIFPDEPGDLDGLKVGVLVRVSGLDRIGLATYLRDQGAQVRVVRRPEDLVSGLAEGRFRAAVTEAMLARSIAAREGWSVALLPAALPRYDLAFGLWKGDLTLKRAVEAAFRDMRADGVVEETLRKYLGAAEITPVPGSAARAGRRPAPASPA